MCDMIREDVEEYLQFAEKAYEAAKFCIRVTPEHAAELCRAWLALDAAPEIDVKECCGHAIIGSDWDDDLTGYNHVGQRVRLVATPASGGQRDD